MLFRSISINALDFITSIIMTLPLWIIMFYFFGLYDRESYTHPLRQFGRILLASVTGIMIMISVTFFTNTPLFPAKLVAVYAAGIGFILLMILRHIINICKRSSYPCRSKTRRHPEDIMKPLKPPYSQPLNTINYGRFSRIISPIIHRINLFNATLIWRSSYINS